MKRLFNYFLNFPLIWIIFALLIAEAIIAYCTTWEVAKIFGYIATGALALILIWKPMNAVYGLMGSSGSISLFFGNFLLITVILTCIYQLAFFHNAGVSYDINQPHIDYDCYKPGDARVSKDVTDTTQIITLHLVNGIEQRDTVKQLQTITYQPITFWQTWRNTITTTLMQEPTDFFAAAATYNAKMDDGIKNNDGHRTLDEQKSAAFQWLLIIQVLISWIFFGVFISLLYNKFRYES